MDQFVVNTKISDHYAKLFKYNSIVYIDLSTPCHPSRGYNSPHQFCSHTVILADKTFYGTKLQHLISEMWHGSQICDHLKKKKNIIDDTKKREALKHFEKYIITDEDFKTRFDEIKIISIWINHCIETSDALREVIYKLDEKLVSKFESETTIVHYVKHHPDMFVIPKEDFEELKQGLYDVENKCWLIEK